VDERHAAVDAKVVIGDAVAGFGSGRLAAPKSCQHGVMFMRVESQQHEGRWIQRQAALLGQPFGGNGVEIGRGRVRGLRRAFKPYPTLGRADVFRRGDGHAHGMALGFRRMVEIIQQRAEHFAGAGRCRQREQCLLNLGHNGPAFVVEQCEQLVCRFAYWAGQMGFQPFKAGLGEIGSERGHGTSFF